MDACPLRRWMVTPHLEKFSSVLRIAGDLQGSDYDIFFSTETGAARSQIGNHQSDRYTES